MVIDLLLYGVVIAVERRSPGRTAVIEDWEERKKLPRGSFVKNVVCHSLDYAGAVSVSTTNREPVAIS
jgi:hypothetical protein